MSQTASGFLRVALLLIATSALALVWSGDQQAQQQFVAARKAAGEQTQSILLARSDSQTRAPHTPISSRSQISRTRNCDRAAGLTATIAAPADHSYVAHVEIEMPLPVGIAPGRYQVVDQAGSVQTIHIRSAPGHCETKDVYTLTRADGSREFFIRLNEETASSAAACTR